MLQGIDDVVLLFVHWNMFSFLTTYWIWIVLSRVLKKLRNILRGRLNIWRSKWRRSNLFYKKNTAWNKVSYEVKFNMNSSCNIHTVFRLWIGSHLKRREITSRLDSWSSMLNFKSCDHVESLQTLIWMKLLKKFHEVVIRLPEVDIVLQI